MRVEFIGGTADGSMKHLEYAEDNYILDCSFSKEIYQRLPVFDSGLNKYSDTEYIYRYVGTEVEIAFKELQKAVDEAYRVNYFLNKTSDWLSSFIVWIVGVFKKKEE